jgi:hypothetical protein
MTSASVTTFLAFLAGIISWSVYCIAVGISIHMNITVSTELVIHMASDETGKYVIFESSGRVASNETGKKGFQRRRPWPILRVLSEHSLGGD